MVYDWLLDSAKKIMLTNNVTKFDDDPLKTIEVIDRTNALDAAYRTCSHNISNFLSQTGV